MTAKKSTTKPKTAKPKTAKPKTKTKTRPPKKQDKAVSHDVAVAHLALIADEANAFLEAAAKADQQSFDRRLSAACKLAEAEAYCAANGVAFKSWSEDNVKYAWSSVRELALVGSAKDPAKALEDLRARGAKRAAKARVKARVRAAGNGSEDRERVTHAAPADPVLAVIDAALALPAGDLEKVAREVASAAGIKLPGATDTTPSALLDAAKRAFDALVPSQRVVFLDYAAGKVGAKVTMPIVPRKKAKKGEAGDPLDIPDFMRRAPAKKGNAKREGGKAA